jgi:hypothetical protein
MMKWKMVYLIGIRSDLDVSDEAVSEQPVINSSTTWQGTSLPNGHTEQQQQQEADTSHHHSRVKEQLNEEEDVLSGLSDLDAQFEEEILSEEPATPPPNRFECKHQS